ncbi:MAG: sulfite oxidase-like oxidoreductase [Methanobacteriota archaeon]|nr:MAG: sulfite oxidase-like oxidoreductase [Euryarchaeota archaeon]
MPEPRIPPGQSVSKRFPRLDLGVIPTVVPDKWDLRVAGSVENPLRFNLPEFHALPKVSVTRDFSCVTGWTRLDCVWEGVAFQTLAAMAKPKPSATSVWIECGEGYTTSLRLEDLMRDDVLLAYGFDGKPLPDEHGGPVRLIVPRKYGWKSAKWVRLLDFRDRHDLGFWEVRGYSDTADPWTEDRYS